MIIGVIHFYRVIIVCKGINTFPCVTGNLWNRLNPNLYNDRGTSVNLVFAVLALVAIILVVVVATEVVVK